MTDRSSAGFSWVCPACDRRVPRKFTECRCGYQPNWAQAPPPQAPEGSLETPLSSLISIVASVVIALSTIVVGAWYVNRHPVSPPVIQAVGRPSSSAGPPPVDSPPPVPGAQPSGSEPPSSPEAIAKAQLAAAAPPLPDMIDRAMPAVVMITTQKSRGSGFFVRPDLIVTSAHVVAGFLFVAVTTQNNQKLNGRVASMSDGLDIALVQVIRLGPTDAQLPLGDSSHLRLGQTVVALGWAESLQQSSVGRGIVTGLRQEEDRAVIQTDAVPQPGDSGGPLLDLQGNVVGITAGRSTFNDNSTAGKAVAIDQVKSLIQRVTANVMMVPLTGAGAGAVVAPRPSDMALKRSSELARYSQTLSALSQRATQLDGSWSRYKAACKITDVPAGPTHEWFHLYDPASALHRTPEWCANVLAQIQQQADAISSDMLAAEEAARRADVLPGVRRDLRRKYRLDYPGWDR